MEKKVEIHGECGERFSAVRKAFMKNFETSGDIGASFAAAINGEFVIDMWAGHADAKQTRPWDRNTIVNVWSTTKVMTALCAHMLVDRGQLDLNAPVAKYWPEFAQAGKDHMPVRYLLSHTSGLSGFEEPIPVEALYDWDRIINMLARQAPWWEPGTRSGYHAITFGYLVGEVVKRITKKSIGTFFKEEVAAPLKADFYIGLPVEHDSRVAELIPPPILKPGDAGYIDPQTVIEQFPIVAKMANPALTAEYTRTRAWRAAEIPAANGHGNARSVVRITSVLACGGEMGGVRLLGMPTIERAIEEQCYSTDLVLEVPIRWGLGFGLNSKEFPISPNPRTFFWGGWGGSFVAVDLDAKLSFAYVMNKMRTGLTGDDRSARLIRALYASL
jgi:CubicO group peptidase (beta-lactamase class C family)